MIDDRSLDLTVDSLEAAKKYCRRLADSHYENFTVVMPLMDKERRQDLANIYTYCRWVDDLADRNLPKSEILADLERFESMLEALFSGADSNHPLFWALSRTVQRRDLNREPFLDLISAFRQDQDKKRYADFAELVDYSQRSAAPVGKLVLSCFDAANELTEHYAEATTVALQLVNFWADVQIDLELGRIYLPREDRERFNVTEAQLKAGEVDENFRELMAFEVERTRDWLRVGWNLVGEVDFPLSLSVELFNAGGWAVLDKLEQNNYDVFKQRWTLSKRDKIILGLRGAWRSLVGKYSPPT